MILHPISARNLSTSTDTGVRPSASFPRTVLALIALGLTLMAPATLASGPSTPTPETLEAVGGVQQSDKAVAYICNPQGNHCFGRWADMILHLFTNADGSTLIYVTPDFEFELNERGSCTLNSGKFIKLLDHGGGERVLLDQLYLSYATDSQFALRLGSEAGTGECYVQYARTLYEEP